MAFISFLQDRLDFKGFSSPQFATTQGLGRVGLIAAILGVSLGFHLCLFLCTIIDRCWNRSFYENESGIIESSLIPKLQLWSLYIIFLSMFHLAEFFVTATYNPSAVSADSFVVNHSKKYTIAVLVSLFLFCCLKNRCLVCVNLTEFWLEPVTRLLSFHSRSFGWKRH